MENITKRGRGRPAGVKSHTHISLKDLYLKLGPNFCVPVSTIFLKDNGFLTNSVAEYKLPEVITQPTAQIKRIDFNQEND